MNFISAIMLVFSALGALDRILGNRFGLGKEFEKGFMLLGNMALSMIGMIILSPLLAELLKPCFDWFYEALHIDPSIIPASLFANDMGGASLSREIARDEGLGMFNALIVSSLMGCTISYSIPYALGVVQKQHHRELFLGMLCGIAAIPVGCLVSGIVLGLPLGMVLLNLLPLILFSGIIACGLMFAPTLTVRVFSWVGILIKVLITAGLALGILEFLTGVKLIPGLGDIREGGEICLNAAIVLSGAFPLMHIVSKLLAKPIQKLGAALQIEPSAAMGFVATIVTNATTFEMMNRMDKKGVFLNAAFSVTAAFLCGSHLAFTLAFDNGYIFAMIVAKAVSGVAALVLAMLLYRRIYRPVSA